MRILKKAIPALLAAIMLFSSGCAESGSGDGVSIVQKYAQVADGFIESGDYESAVKALEEGVAKTGSKVLSDKLDGVNATIAEEEEKAKKEAEEQAAAEKAAEEERAKEEAAAAEKAAEQERLKALTGTYFPPYYYISVTLFLEDGSLKAFVDYNDTCGYFDLTEEQSGCYVVANDGYKLKKNGEQTPTRLIYDVLDYFFSDGSEMPNKMRLIMLPDTDECVIVFNYGENDAYNEVPWALVMMKSDEIDDNFSGELY